MTHQIAYKFVGVFFMSALIVSTFSVPNAHASSSKSKPSIELTAPKQKSSFAKEGSGIIPIAWSAKNVPEDTLVIVELDHKKLVRGGSGIGGGSWQQEISTGNSTGTHNWDIEGEGRPSAGTYRIRALLQECVEGDCTQNPFFPGMKKTKTYTKSKWIPITITKGAAKESAEATASIATRPTGKVSVTLTMDGKNGDTFTLTDDSQPTFNYYPSGDVESCTMTAYYEGGDRTVEHGWKNGVKAGQSGTASFSAVEVYPLQTLQSVEVVCGNAKNRGSDTITFETSTTSVSADFKVLTGKTGRTTFKKGNGTRSEVEAYCKQAYNDSEIHKNTRVQCYFDGEKFEDVKGFKG